MLSKLKRERQEVGEETIKKRKGKERWSGTDKEWRGKGKCRMKISGGGRKTEREMNTSWILEYASERGERNMNIYWIGLYSYWGI